RCASNVTTRRTSRKLLVIRTWAPPRALSVMSRMRARTRTCCAKPRSKPLLLRHQNEGAFLCDKMGSTIGGDRDDSDSTSTTTLPDYRGTRMAQDAHHRSERRRLRRG